MHWGSTIFGFSPCFTHFYFFCTHFFPFPPRGGVEKNCAHGKKLRTPPPSRGCLRKKSCPAIIVAFGNFFTQGQLLVQKWNSLHQISLCTLACTELFEPIDHFKFVLLVEVICEGAFFFCF